MIITPERDKVIENIKQAVACEQFNISVEPNDPVITNAERKKIIDGYLNRRKTLKYRIKSAAARNLANKITRELNKDTEIIGLEKLNGLDCGAFITSNHFNPSDSTPIRLLTKRLGKKRINVICKETNFAMTGMLGFLLNYADTIPITSNVHYMHRDLPAILSALFAKKEFVLIYPEQEMWFNYKKPRPMKEGAYYYASKLNVPIISCFVEMCNLDEMQNESFHKIKYRLHILDILKPDPEKTSRENTSELMEKDKMLKKLAYEKAYGKKLNYNFEENDIAGWVGEMHDEKEANKAVL